MNYIVTKKEKPPLGLMGGSAHDYERGENPFSQECMPREFWNYFSDKTETTGWLVLDWCGNIIGFAPDGTEIILPTPLISPNE